MGYSLGLPFLSAASMLINIMYAEGKGHNVVVSFILSIAVNVCGDIYVASTTRSVFDIGLATSGSNIVSCAYLVFCRLGGETAVRLSVRRFKPSLITSIIKGGSTTGAIRASHMLRTWTLNILLTFYFGKEAVSALSVQSSVTSLFLCIAVGTGTAILLIGSVFYGENNEDSMKQLMHRAVVSSMTMCLGILAVSFFAVGPLVGLNTDNSSVARLARQGVMIFVLGLPFFTLDMTFVQYYMAVKKYYAFYGFERPL